MLLKDHLRQLGEVVKNNHDVPLMLANLAIKSPPQTANINALNTALKANLTRLWCEGPTRTQNVPTYSYPYIRYVRHDSEYASDCSPEADIQDLELLTQQIQALLFSITGASA
jgi:hypothetical protein